MTSTDPMSLTPLTRSITLRDAVLEQLRTAIITGELAEGSVVSAPTLGAQLGVSATPVREAMMELTRAGLVEPIKNKGFRITTMTGSELDDLVEIRLLIEPPMMHRVVGLVGEAVFTELNALAEDCLRAAEAENLTAYLRDDRELHALILRCAGNAELVELITQLRLRTRLYGLRALARKGQLADSAREHLDLIRMLRAGDADGAEALMRAHIGHVRDIWATGDLGA